MKSVYTLDLKSSAARRAGSSPAPGKFKHMNIFITASKQFYPIVAEVKEKLEILGHTSTPPNGYDHPEAEDLTKNLSPKEYREWKGTMIRTDGKIVAAHDAILVLNFEKNGIQNYIGGATFLEIFKAFELGKKIYLYNPIPEGMLTDELIGMSPQIIYGNLTLVQ